MNELQKEKQVITKYSDMIFILKSWFRQQLWLQLKEIIIYIIILRSL